MTTRLNPPKRPEEVRNYRHDWTPWLGADTISTHTTTATGVTLVSTTVEAGNRSVIFKVSAGTAGTVGTIDHRIVTAAGETEAEIFTVSVETIDEPVNLGEAKAYLRVTHSDEDNKIAAMIPRARLWVEDHTGLALTRRTFVERHLPGYYNTIHLTRGPLVSVTTVAYTDTLGSPQTYVPRSFPPEPRLYSVTDQSWPSLKTDEEFTVTYVAGYATAEDVDDRLLGAMYALIEGEYAEGYCYPPRAIEAADAVLTYQRAMVA